MKPKLLHLIFLSTLLASCDPVQVLIFENDTDSDVRIQIVETGSSIESIKHNVRNNTHGPIGDTTVVELGTDNTKTFAVDFGLGTWERHHHLDSFLAHLQEVNFIQGGDTLFFRDRSRLDSLFRTNLAGKLKESIMVRIAPGFWRKER